MYYFLQIIDNVKRLILFKCRRIFLFLETRSCLVYVIINYLTNTYKYTANNVTFIVFFLTFL